MTATALAAWTLIYAYTAWGGYCAGWNLRDWQEARAWRTETP